MLTQDLVDLPLEVMGGFTPALAPTVCPPGASPLAQDCDFPEGAVTTRGGLLAVFGPGNGIPANATINGLKTYLTPQIQRRLMVWDSLGNLYKESPDGTLTTVANSIFGAKTLYQATTLFGREYSAYYAYTDPLLGLDIPRQYDDTNWDRVSQVGPGSIVGIMTAVNSATAGNIVAGKHQVTVSFITRQGFITQPSPPIAWTANGAHQVDLAGIPIGPANIVGRLIMFTPVITPPAFTGTFYSTPTGTLQLATPTIMVISDNTTTTITLDFLDSILIASFNAQYLFTQIELGECASVGGYNSRLAWLGERNKVQNFSNLTFDGGFNGATPYGWTTHNAGGGSAVAGGSLGDWQDAYTITGDGITAQRGLINQGAWQDWLGVPIIAANTSYSVRARIAKANMLTQGTLHINLHDTGGGGLTTVGLSVTAGQLSGDVYTEFIATITDAPYNPVPSGLVLQVYADGTPTNAGVFLVDSIEIFPTNQPYNFSTVRFSHSFNPESYDGTTGSVQIRPNDGQILHASFPLRNNFYFGKDHYLCYVTDDGLNEPASWAVNEVSATVGICGPNAVDWTEEWAVFAERSGLYIFWGSDPVKITPEIQQDASKTGKICWNSINWASSQSIWVRIDKVNKQILVGVPIGVNAVLPNTVFMLDYKWLDGAADIAGSPMVTYSAFTGKVLAHGRGRRWMVWNIAAASMTFAERADGTVQPFYGNSIGNGKIYEQLPPQVQASDDGVAINSFYSTYYAPSHVEEQIVQLGAHQKLLGYLKWRATGNGILSIAIITTRRTTNLRGYILGLTTLGDGERGVEVAGERFSIQVGTNAVGSWFSMEQLILSMKKHPTFVVRGTNA